jgi:hypothetical protein
MSRSLVSELIKELSFTDSAIVEEMKKVDLQIDKRFQAFDEVVQSQIDMIEDVDKKLNKLFEKPSQTDNKADFDAIKKSFEDLKVACNRPYPIINLSPLQNEVQNLAKKILELEQKQLHLNDMLDKLINGKRYAVYKANGDIDYVVLEK